MQSEVTDLIKEAGQVVGLHAVTEDGPLEVGASQTVGADGRQAVVRARAGLKVDELGAPMDVLWLSIFRSLTIRKRPWLASTPDKSFS